MTDLRLRCRGYDLRAISALVVLLLVALPMTALGQGGDSLVLARVEVTKALQESGLPVYTQLPDENGRFFAKSLDLAQRAGLEWDKYAPDVGGRNAVLVK